MSPAEHDILRRSEDGGHWWYAVLHQLVLEQMQRHVEPGARVLDAGCGTGGMMARLRDWDTHGIDISKAALAHCWQRGLRQTTLCGVEQLPHADASFDVVLSLDVLYHSAVDETRALAEMARVLRPGGLLIVNLPAFSCLRGAHDVAVSGARRYRRCQVRDLLTTHNLTVEMTHYWNSWLFLPLLLWRVLTRLENPAHGAKSDLQISPAGMNTMLARLSSIDAALCRRLGLPFGTSVFATARRTVPS